jgi:Htaa
MTRSIRLALVASASLTTWPAAAATATAAPVSVLGGSVDWTQVNVYNAAPERTFLGHTTNPGSVLQGRSNGTALTSSGATTLAPDGASVDGVRPESQRGSGQGFTFRFPSASGTFDRAARTLDVTTTGTLTYAQYPALTPAPPAPIVLSGLRITLNGNTGAVYAAASGPAGAADYPGEALFTLNATQAQITPLGAGRYAVAGLVPTLAKAGIFGTAGQYAPGTSGPDRTPNTWGGFSLVVDTEPAATPTVVERDRIVERVVERTVASRQVVVKRSLGRSPFKTPSVLEVSLRRSGSTAVLGEGYVRGTRLVVIVPEGTALEGKYVLRRLSGSKRLARSASVTFGAAAATKKAR